MYGKGGKRSSRAIDLPGPATIRKILQVCATGVDRVRNFSCGSEVVSLNMAHHALKIFDGFRRPTNFHQGRTIVRFARPLPHGSRSRRGPANPTLVLQLRPTAPRGRDSTRSRPAPILRHYARYARPASTALPVVQDYGARPYLAV